MSPMIFTFDARVKAVLIVNSNPGYLRTTPATERPILRRAPGPTFSETVGIAGNAHMRNFARCSPPRTHRQPSHAGGAQRETAYAKGTF